MREPVPEPDRRHDLIDPRTVGLLARNPQRQEDVLLGREHREQVEELEDEADVPPAELGQRVVAEVADLRVGDPHVALVRSVEPGEDVHQRGLTGARRPHDCDQLALGDGKRHSAQGVHRGVARAVAAGETVPLDDDGRPLGQPVDRRPGA